MRKSAPVKYLCSANSAFARHFEFNVTLQSSQVDIRDEGQPEWTSPRLLDHQEFGGLKIASVADRREDPEFPVPNWNVACPCCSELPTPSGFSADAFR